ncbi:hypothetical protein ABXJ76_09480 [Methylobacter sp. G7]|uniref:hypothetical protein n=1 Tax=Methylobacter sp. G7 TaxID=3230117 RepID=UPI003D801CFE
MATELHKNSRVVSIVDSKRLFVGMVATGGMAMAPVSAAISAVFHCLIGSALAGVWGRRR